MLRPERHGRPVRRRGTGVRVWLDHAALALGLGALLLGFSTVVEAGSWTWTVAVVAGLPVLACAAWRAAGLRGAPVVGLVVGFVAAVWVFVPETLAGGVVPTPASFAALRDLLSVARVMIMEEAAPAPAARPVVLVVALAFALLVVVADVVLSRRGAPLLFGLLLLAVLVTPSLISGRSPEVGVVVAAAAAWLVVLWTRTGSASSGFAPAVVLGAGGLLASVVLPPVLPDVSGVARDWGAPPPAVFGDGINPMLQLGQNLRRGETSVAATYTTELDDTPYLRAAVLRDFNGRTWRPVERGVMGRAEGNLVLGEAIPSEPARTEITIDELSSTMLPVPYPATSVSGLPAEWSWNRVGQTLSSASGDSSELEYVVTSLDVQPTAEQMRALPESFRPGLEEYLRLPGDVPPSLVSTAREVTAEADNDYDRALALQEHFRSEYEYSETAPVAGDYDGNGMRVLGRFLQEQSGYCVHFSSAMAVMARILDIPSRIVVGYAPGSPVDVVDGDQVYEITSDDLHAWPELYFEGAGWVGFEPTPSVGTPTRFSEPQAPDGADGGSATPEEQQEGSRALEQGGDPGASTVSEDPPSSARAVLGAGGLLLVLALVPAGVRAVQRRARLRSDDAEAWWRELRATALDHRLAVSDADTPRAFVARLSEGRDDADLAVLLDEVEERRYGRPGTVGVSTREDAARRAVRELGRRSTRRIRLAARLAPRSLLRRPRN